MERLVWCLRHQNFDFSNYIFVDESAMRTYEFPLFHSRFPSTYPDAVAIRSNVRIKINMWGGISFRGPTNFVAFEKFVLVQDNDRKHSSLICRNLLDSTGIFWVRVIL